MTGTALWALILAAGNDVQSSLAGTRTNGRPLQFSPLFGDKTLLDLTRRRVESICHREHQLIVVNRAHEAFYGYLAEAFTADRLVAQPMDRGTGVGILYALTRLHQLSGNVRIAIIPSDHYVDDDAKFMECVQEAANVVSERPEDVVLLGVEADRPETDYGWIEPNPQAVSAAGRRVFRIQRFWEKPSAGLSRRLLETGCLWNSFVMVGWASAFLKLFETARPDLWRAFAPIRQAIGTPDERQTVEHVYEWLQPVDCSNGVLQPSVDRLLTFAVDGVGWSDWGHPARVAASLRRLGRRPTVLSSSAGTRTA